MTYGFYDTSSLLIKGNKIFDNPNEQIIISSITLQELENIKTSIHKDENIKYQARQLTNLLSQYADLYITWLYTTDLLKETIAYGDNNDMKILACAIDADKYYPDNLIFYTNDLALKNIANTYFGNDSIKSVEEEFDDYSGYKEMFLTEDEMSNFYSSQCYNWYDLCINQYLIIRNTEGECVDALKWNGIQHEPLKYTEFKSNHFGAVKPIKGDIYQALAADSLSHNKITMLKGRPGSGKTLLSLGYLLSQLERGKIEKIIVFCNTVATVNSARLGFYPGSRDEKLLDSQIGNLLASKFGGKIEVERMIQEEKLMLLPLSDIRGFDTTGMKAGIYISEAQNLDITLMKLALQRIGEDSICIIDGDEKTQVDNDCFAGARNGMRRVSKVFRGDPSYGEIELKYIHRSHIAELAERM